MKGGESTAAKPSLRRSGPSITSVVSTDDAYETVMDSRCGSEAVARTETTGRTGPASRSAAQYERLFGSYVLFSPSRMVGLYQSSGSPSFHETSVCFSQFSSFRS